MRLFLSSSGLSADPLALAGLVPAGARTAVVANALDNVADHVRSEIVHETFKELALLGLDPFELDLRQQSADGEPSREALGDADLVWVTGGNVFVLRKAFAESGLDTLLMESIAANSIAYGGFSAGACLAGPTLRGLELVDDVHAVSGPIWDGLGLVDFSIAPHYRSAHPESARMEQVVAYFRSRSMHYRELGDGEAIVATPQGHRVIGRQTKWRTD